MRSTTHDGSKCVHDKSHGVSAGPAREPKNEIIVDGCSRQREGLDDCETEYRDHDSLWRVRSTTHDGSKCVHVKSHVVSARPAREPKNEITVDNFCSRQREGAG